MKGAPAKRLTRRIGPFALCIACVGGCYEAERPSEYTPKTQALDCAHKATLAVQAGNLEEGLALFGEAIAADPKYVLAYKGKAAVLGMLQRYEEAVQALQPALQQAPEDADAYLAQGIFLELSDHKAEARVCYATALEKYDALSYRMEADLDRRLARVQTLYLLRGRTEALKAINEVLEKYPDNEWAKSHKYRILADQRDAYLNPALPAQPAGEAPSGP